MRDELRRSYAGSGGIYRRVQERIGSNGQTLGPSSIWSRTSWALGRAAQRTSQQIRLRQWAALYDAHSPTEGAAVRVWRLSRGCLLVWLASSLIFSVLTLRIVFRLVSADPLVTVVEGIYHASDLLMGPLLGLTELPRAGLGVIDVPALLALVAYAALALLLTWLLRVGAK